MSLPRPISTWLLACALACLCTLCVVSPKMWRVARQPSTVETHDGEQPTASPLVDRQAERAQAANCDRLANAMVKGTAVVVRPVNRVSPLTLRVSPPAVHFPDHVTAELATVAFPPSSNALLLQVLGLDSQGWSNRLSAWRPSEKTPIAAERTEQVADHTTPAMPPERESPIDVGAADDGPSLVAPAEKIGAKLAEPLPQAAKSHGPKMPAPAESLTQKGQADRQEASSQSPQKFTPADKAQRLPVAVANIPSRILPTPRTFDEPSGEAYSTDVDPSSSGKPSESERRRILYNVDDSWQSPETLLETLTELAAPKATAKWAADVIRQIRALGPAMAGKSDESGAILDRLAALNAQASPLASKTSDKLLARKLRKASYALARRLDVWQEVVRLGGARPTDDTPVQVDRQKLALCLAEVDSLTADSSEGRAWRDYLLLDALKASAKKTSETEDVATQQIAQQVLARLTQTPLTSHQQKFVASGPVAALRSELRRWAAEPVGAAAILREIETYERTCLPSDAGRLARDCQNLTLSSSEERRQLADRLDMHYRNANFRMAVTEELINKLIPEQNLEYSLVDETVLGRPVRGESLMATELAVRMAPDPRRVRMVLEVRGEISSATTADAGAARLHNESESYYIARKPLEIDMSGVRVWPVEVGVENNTQLRGVESQLDGMPLIGPLVRGVAKIQSDQSKSAASAEVKSKIASQARQRVDDEARQRLSEFVDRMNQRVFDPLNALSLDPQLIDAETTDKRFTMRLRLAGEDQLGSHTPRPQAPANSLASVQLHESVINNGIQRLQLNGRTFTLAELSEHVAKRLNRPTPWETNPEHADVKITFVEKDAIVVRCQDGQIILSLSIAQLSKSPRKWKNFRIEASYRPRVEGRSVQLARDGVIRLIGRLSMGSQIALRGIFSHALSKNNAWDMVPPRIVNEPKLNDLAVTQFVIDDGWIGVAMGPKPAVSSTTRRTGSHTR